MSDDPDRGPAFRIRAVWVYAAIDPDDGEEGVMAFSTRMGVMMPMVASDEKRRDILRPIAEQIGRAKGVTIKLLKFSLREEIETLGGGA